jgi:hypothetical protein
VAISNFSIHDLKNLQICPDLPYFKKVKELETSLEKTFYQNFLHEFDETELKENLLERSMEDNSYMEDSFHMADNMEQDNVSLAPSQHTQSVDSHNQNNFEDNMILLNNETFRLTQQSNPNLMQGMSFLEGFSYLKPDEIKDYIQQFGDGNRQTLKMVPQYKEFAKNFNNLDKINNVLAVDTLKNRGRPKKEEKLFTFSLENETCKNDIFELNERKNQDKLAKKDRAKDFKKKKVKMFYYYDRSM